MTAAPPPHKDNFYILFTIVAFQIQVLHLAHKRISRVCRCTLIVECLLGHLIQSLQELLLIDAVSLDGIFDLDIFL